MFWNKTGRIQNAINGYHLHADFMEHIGNSKFLIQSPNAENDDKFRGWWY